MNFTKDDDKVGLVRLVSLTGFEQSSSYAMGESRLHGPKLYCLFNLGIKSSSRLLFSDLVWRTLIGWWYLTLWTVVAGPWCCYLAMWLEASSHTTIGSHDCDEAASLIACGNLYMEVGAKPLEVGARHRKLARLAQWGILSHFVRNLVQQVSRIWKVICGQSCQQQTDS